MKMGIKNNYLKYVFILSVLLITMPTVLGTLVSPANSEKISGIYTLNATNSTAFNNIVNCSFYAKSSLTANSSWSLINSSAINTTTTTVIGTFDSNTLEDANNYQFNATCRNYSNSIQSEVGTATVTVDNDIPDTPTITSHTNQQVVSSTGTQTFIFTVNNSETTSCTYTAFRGGGSSDGSSGAGTYSGDSCSFTKDFLTSSDNGEWYITATASDETNTTTSGTTIVSVQIANAGGGNGQITTPAVIIDVSNPLVWIVGVIVIIALILLIWFIFN